MQDFSHYRDFYEPKMVNHPLGTEFLSVLDWLADKPCHEFGYQDIARAVFGSEDLVADGLLHKVLPLAVMMTTWAQPVAKLFFLVKDSSGKFHEPTNLDSDVIDGKMPFVVPETGEVIADFAENAYVRFRAADYAPESRASLEQSPTPRC